MIDDLEAIKSDQRLVKLYSQYTKLKKEGDKYTGLCPIHREKNQSFAVWGKDMMWTCFSGGCGNGNIFQFIQKMDNTDFKGALAKVKDFLGQNQWEAQKEKVEQTFRAVVDTNKVYKIFDINQFSKYTENLKSSKDGQDWLASRGITLETAVKLHWGYRQSVGDLAGEKNAECADKGWICMPCLKDDKVVSIKYRSIASKIFTKQPGMETTLHGLESIDVFDDIYLVEGEVDRASFEQYGFKAVSLPSASTNVTPEMKDQLMRANRVILAGDSDEVGSAAMDKLWRDLSERTFMLRWPGDCKDANDLLRQDPSKFKEKVEELTKQALKQPAPDIYNLQDVMMAGSDFSLQDNPSRLFFPWPSIDKMTVLLPGSVLAVYATSTGTGKTTWVHQLGLYNAMKYGRVVINYQAEMQPEELAIMTAAQLLRKNRNFLTKSDQVEAAKELDGVSYFIGANPHISGATEILDIIEGAIRRFGGQVVILDHFHHICADLTNENAVQSMAAQRIKQMAEQYKCIFISVGQPRKATTQTKGKIPHISDAKGSEAYTSKANAVFALHRALNKSNDDSPQNDMFETKMLVQAQKTRSKGTGAAEAFLTGFLEFACFEEIDYHHSEPQ